MQWISCNRTARPCGFLGSGTSFAVAMRNPPYGDTAIAVALTPTSSSISVVAFADPRVPHTSR
jgi:hypothetical protein